MTIMGKELSKITIAGRACYLYEQASLQCLLVQPLGVHETDTLPNEIEEIAAASSMTFAMAAFEIVDWERDLMPWGDPAVSKRPEAGTGAVDTLQYLLDGLLPGLKERYGELPVVLGGYSLAGLFPLWSARETNAFTGIAAASPSVWIQGWPEYAASHPLQARQVYLSLGEREEKTRNRAIAQVGERIRNEHALLERQLGESNCTGMACGKLACSPGVLSPLTRLRLPPSIKLVPRSRHYRLKHVYFASQRLLPSRGLPF